MAKTCAIFAYMLLACSKWHAFFYHEASQGKQCAWLSAASDKAEFVCSAFADVEWLQFNTSYQNGVIRNLPDSRDYCDSGGMLFKATQAQMAPQHGYWRASLSGAMWQLEKE
jgi:hypothetical protein